MIAVVYSTSTYDHTRDAGTSTSTSVYPYQSHASSQCDFEMVLPSISSKQFFTLPIHSFVKQIGRELEGRRQIRLVRKQPFIECAKFPWRRKKQKKQR